MKYAMKGRFDPSAYNLNVHGGIKPLKNFSNRPYRGNDLNIIGGLSRHDISRKTDSLEQTTQNAWVEVSRQNTVSARPRYNTVRRLLQTYSGQKASASQYR